MCGIVSGIAQRDISAILLEGLKRLEYRGYDSAGIATINAQGEIHSQKEAGKVAVLEEALNNTPLEGRIGIAHTRWATHGKPSKENAHPHHSLPVALVHNGIIENHDVLKKQLLTQGYEFVSETDTEVVAHLINSELVQNKAKESSDKKNELLGAVKSSIKKIEGAYALAVVCEQQPDVVIGTRKGSPLVVGIGIGEMYLASDPLALRQVTDRFIYLMEGDVVELRQDSLKIWDENDQLVERQLEHISDDVSSADKGTYRHYMLKEIFEQPSVVSKTLEGRLGKKRILSEALGPKSNAILEKTKAIQIVACGTSYHAGMVAKYWFEEMAGIPCAVEVASEFRYRKAVVMPDTLLITISQSGETADTLAALRKSREKFIAAMTICNVAQSSLVRESDIVMLTHAGPEIGVASTKAFTTQLTALLISVVSIAKYRGMSAEAEEKICKSLHTLPQVIESCLKLDKKIKRLADQFSDKQNCIFLGRGTMYPVAQEGSLKLKEISYIHAEAYPAGELKHGPLALVDEHMPIVAVAPNNELLEKLKSNLEEVQARGGKLYVFADQAIGLDQNENMQVINMPHTDKILEPIVYTIPLQLFSYYVAVNKGTDVDQPRNLAKSVTVE